jgi:hypothetical protein
LHENGGGDRGLSAFATFNRNKYVNVFPSKEEINWFNIFLSPRILQSVRRHSAIVFTGTVYGMQEIRPVIYLLLKFNHK